MIDIDHKINLSNPEFLFDQVTLFLLHKSLKIKIMKSFQKGLYFEQKAKEILIEKGLSILGQRIKSRIGEIDLLAKKDLNLYIVEVKHRKTLEKAAYSVSQAQFYRSLNTLYEFLNKHPIIFENIYYIAILFSSTQYKILNIDSFYDFPN